MFLAISTSSGISSASILDIDGNILFSIFGEKKNKQSSELPVIVNELLSKINKEEILKIFVDIGPGSFTGIRTGIALSIGLEICGPPMYGVSILDAIKRLDEKKYLQFNNTQYYYQIDNDIYNVKIIEKDQIVNNELSYIFNQSDVNSDMIGKCGILLMKDNILYDAKPIYTHCLWS